ncbi:Isonitrile hydratase [Pseudomonas fluorescens]|uniref:Isonitrile hydratase n=1 Tax=Pseudomonas fluorescens TaxID=294 RepID=A0A5E6REG1_PSEFL|nr:DJ-1/PfpI family protein [Pseudomonas fluorescens]VVM67364.1 Isonitrile hydratase [Pseudomonas fluorescens]
MKRRQVVASLAASGLGLALFSFQTHGSVRAPAVKNKLEIPNNLSGSTPPLIRIGMIVYNELTQLDFTGPFEIFARIPEVEVLVVSQTLDLVTSDVGLRLVPTHTFETAGKIDVLFVPGGPGQSAQMDNSVLLDYLRRTASQAKYVTSVCTGSLLLAAAGLLTGYKATCHWLLMDQLAIFDVQVTPQRIVIDRNRITGAGITSGMDFALTVAALLRGGNVAKLIELILEYDPAPPFGTGTPTLAGPELVAKVKQLSGPMLVERRAQSLAAYKRLHSENR